MKATQEKLYQDYKKQLNKFIVKPMARLAAKEESNSPEQEKQLTKEFSKLMNDGLEGYASLIHEGIMLLQIEGKLPASFLDGRSHALIKNAHNVTGQVPQEILGITDDELVVIYSLAREYYQRTAYHEAQALFLLMLEINPTVALSWQGLGMCLEQEAKYKEAAALYIMAAELDEDDFNPYIWASDCLSKAGQEEERKHILEHALERCKERPDKKIVEHEIRKMLNSKR